MMNYDNNDYFVIKSDHMHETPRKYFLSKQRIMILHEEKTGKCGKIDAMSFYLSNLIILADAFFIGSPLPATTHKRTLSFYYQ